MLTRGKFRSSLVAAATALALTSLALATGGSRPAAAATTVTTAWHDGSFAENTAGVVSRSDVVLGQPNFSGAQSLPLGNGSLGVAEWAADGFTAQLNRDDTFPDRKSPGLVEIPGLAAMTTATDFTGRLDVYDGLLTESGGGMTVKAWVSARQDLLIVDVTGANPAATQTASVNLWSGRTPTAAAAAGTGTLAETWVDNTQTGASGQTFGSLAAMTAGGRDVTASVADPEQVQVSFKPYADGSYRIAVAAPHWAGGNAAATAARLLTPAVATSETGLLSGSESWWHSYWAHAGLLEMSSPDGSAQYLENIRTLYLYAEAASMRGTYAGSQAGVADMFAYDQDRQDWYPSGYWIWNLRGQVSANLSSGNAALNTPLLDMYLRDLPAIESWTKAQMGGLPGACVPETMRFNGNGYYNGGSSSENASCALASSPSYNAETITSGAEVALWIWQEYTDTGDLGFLRKYYPVMRESARFLLAYATKGPDGLLHTFGNAHENQWAVPDPTTDIAARQALFPAVAQAAGILGTDPGLAVQLDQAATELPPYARTDQATLTQLLTPAADASGTDVIADSYQPAAQLHNVENTGMEPVWPYGVIGDDTVTAGGDDLTALADRSYAYRPNVNVADWNFDAVDAARLDMSGQVQADLIASTEKYQSYLSGMAAWQGSIGDEPYIEQSSGVATALDEALATDYDGLLRIAPAWPSGWDVSGTVYVRNNTKVDVQVQNGTVSTAAIISGASQGLTVRNPWPGQQAEIVNGATGKVVVTPTTAATLQFHAASGSSYLVEQAASPTTSYPFAEVTGTAAAAAKHLGKQQIGLDAPPRAAPEQVTPVITQVSPPAGSLQVVLANHTDTSSTVTAVNWTLGSSSGTQVLDTTIAPLSSATVSVDVGSPSFGQIYPFTVTSVVSGGQGSVPLSGHVTFLPVVQKSLGSSWSLSDVQGGPSVDLGSWEGVGSSQPPAGLAGKVWFDWDSTNLYVTADITDNNFSEPATGVNIWQGDSLQLAATSGVPGSSATVSTASTEGHYEYGAALTPEGAQVYRWTAPTGQATGPVTDAAVHVTRDDATHTTLYELALPWSDLTSVQPGAGSVFSISALLNDTDNGTRLGFLQWGGGIGSSKDVAQFNMAQLMP